MSVPVRSDSDSVSSPAAGPRGGRGSSGGRTHIAPAVVAMVAGVAARGVRGVHALGGGAAAGGALSRVREALPGGGAAPPDGVQVEVGEVQAAFDLSVVADYGMPLRGLAEEVRERVIGEVEKLTGYQVTEVNIAVVDVYLDDEEDQA